MVSEYLGAIIPSLGGVRDEPPEQERMSKLFRQREYTDLIGLVRGHMRIPTKIRVGYVNSGGRSAPMWVATPKQMPFFGTPQISATECTVFVRKDFLARVHFETFLVGVAHEMSHILLYALQHPLKHEEEAVDLCAMASGYSKFFITGHELDHGHSIERVGYLSREEIIYAAGYIAAAQTSRRK